MRTTITQTIAQPNAPDGIEANPTPFFDGAISIAGVPRQSGSTSPDAPQAGTGSLLLNPGASVGLSVPGIDRRLAGPGDGTGNARACRDAVAQVCYADYLGKIERDPSKGNAGYMEAFAWRVVFRFYWNTPVDSLIDEANAKNQFFQDVLQMNPNQKINITNENKSHSSTYFYLGAVIRNLRYLVQHPERSSEYLGDDGEPVASVEGLRKVFQERLNTWEGMRTKLDEMIEAGTVTVGSMSQLDKAIVDEEDSWNWRN